MQIRIEGLQEENNGSERILKTVRDKLVDWDLQSHLSGIYIFYLNKNFSQNEEYYKAVTVKSKQYAL